MERRHIATIQATIRWTREGAFAQGQYRRAHTWSFDGGLTVPASSSPQVVPIPLSNPAHVDPEEAFVAAVSSCHMLWFLSLAADRGFSIEHYTDLAEGEMDRTAAGKQWIKRVALRPHVVFEAGSTAPTDADMNALHHAAHAECFIANSVRSVIETQGTWEI